MITNLITHLTTNVALVSGRVYSVTAPQTVARPYLVFSMITDTLVYSHQGFSNLSRPRVQISCYAETYGGVRAVAAQVVTALHSFVGVGTAKAVFVDSVRDQHEPDTGLYHTSVDALIWHK